MERGVNTLYLPHAAPGGERARMWQIDRVVLLMKIQDGNQVSNPNSSSPTHNTDKTVQ